MDSFDICLPEAIGHDIIRPWDTGPLDFRPCSTTFAGENNRQSISSKPRQENNPLKDGTGYMALSCPGLVAGSPRAFNCLFPFCLKRVFTNYCSRNCACKELNI